MKFWEKLRKILYDICDVLELFMAVSVGIGLVIAMLAIFPGIADLWNHRLNEGAFMEFLGIVFNLVIGIEFMKMLCKPNTSNIIEALIFLMARHMIIRETTALEDLTVVISICILFLFRRFMLATKPDKEHHVPNIFRAIKIAQSPEFQEALIRYREEEKEREKEKYNGIDIDDFRAD